MSARQLLTVFGATGQQGGSVIDVILDHPEIKDKYALRGVTRDVSSKSSEALKARGVEMVAASFDDPAALRNAVNGSYGVFGVTNFWDPKVMKKDIEMQQGKNIFDAVKAEGVKHYVYSSLPHVERLTNGVLKHMEHFDGKAEVEDYINENKGDMIVSYFMPAAYTGSYLGQIHDTEHGTAMVMPFEADVEKDEWPVIDAVPDSGKWIVGLFEGGQSADGAKVQGVSYWTSPKEFIAAVGKNRGKEITFHSVSQADYIKAVPSFMSAAAEELSETMITIGVYSYYGKGSKKNQPDSDKWLAKGTETVKLSSIA